jgi:hypothetical protein
MTTLDFKPFVLLPEDTKLQKLTKIRDFLVLLKQTKPERFDYAHFIYAKDFVTGAQNSPTVTNYYRDVVAPTIRWCNDLDVMPATDDRTERALEHKTYDCGTCACVAGWTNLLSRIPNQNENEFVFADDLAGLALELNSEDKDFLFQGYGGHDIEFVSIRRATIDDALERLNILIKECEPTNISE